MACAPKPFARGLAVTLTAIALSLSILRSLPAQVAERSKEAPAADEPACVEPPADGAPVKVVDAATRKPVAGALVTWFSQSTGSDSGELVPEPQLLELRRRFGMSVRTGTDGVTKVGSFRWLVASDGTRYAGASHAVKGQTLVLELKPSRSVLVATVDRDGKPVGGVPIALRSREHGRGARDEWLTATGADGRVSIAPLDLFATFHAEALREIWIAVDAPLAAPLNRSFTLAEIPAQPIEFEMPPTGRMVIDVVDAQGRPDETLGAKTVRARYDFDPERAAPENAGARWPAVEWFVWDDRSHHELPHVETGLRVVVSARRRNDMTATSIVDGPKSAGETVAVRLVIPDPESVSGRILDEKGDPIANQEVTLFVMEKSNRLRRRSFAKGTTDADGRLHAAISIHLRPSGDDKWMRFLEPTVHRSDGKGVLASALIELPNAKWLESRDFGEVRVHPSPLFAKGVVDDDAGAPVAGASLSLTALPTESFTGSYLTRSDDVLRSRSSADGTFEIWGEAPNGELHLSASVNPEDRATPLMASDRVEFKAGAADLRLVLWRAGTVTSRVVGDLGGAGRLGLSVRWTRVDGQVSGFSRGVADDGTIEFLAPVGVASFTVEQGSTPIASRSKIEVKPGAVIEVPPIELAGANHEVELTIVDELDHPIPEGWIAMPDPEEVARIAEMAKHSPPESMKSVPLPREANVTTFENGKSTLRSERAIPTFAVGAAGRTAVVVRHAASAERVVLEPAPRVALVVDYDGDPIPAPFHFLATISHPNDDEEWFRFGPDAMFPVDSLQLPRLDGITLERAAAVDAPLRCLGRTRIDLVLGQESPGGVSGTTIGCDPCEIDFVRTPERQFVHLKVARAAIDAVLKQLSQH